MTAGKVRIGISNMDPQQYLTFMSGDNDGSPEYTALTIDEVVRFPGTPLAFSIEDGVLSRER
ncbi:MAG TPA: hypothetical protein DCY26_03385, partial [Hyphomonas sp.]|nr:hypothetical protein [Hyphomonas sp.]